jgi:uncharacterized protein (DUF2267 family)
VDYDEFIRIIEQQADVGRARAEQAARAVLRTLAERIARGEALDLAAALPPEAAPWLHKDSPDAEGFDVDEFVRRVANWAGSDATTATLYVRATFTALCRAVGRKEMEDVASELSRDFAPLLPVGPDVEIVSAPQFFEAVMNRTGLDREGARAATYAVLETLAERVAGGEVDDLVMRLPLELHPPLKAGRAASGGKATRMSREDFVARVAEREGVDRDTARDHTRAVFAVLRETLPDKEFHDLDSQLGSDYDVFLTHR